MTFLVSHVNWNRSSNGLSEPLNVMCVHLSRESQHLQGRPRNLPRFTSSLHGRMLPFDVWILVSKRGRNKRDFRFRGCRRAAMSFLFSITVFILWLGARMLRPSLTMPNTFGLAQLLVKTKGMLDGVSISSGAVSLRMALRSR